MKRFLCILLLAVSVAAFGQTKPAGNTKRILILLDGSGSMVDPWQGTNKWEVAKKLVTRTIDSIQQADPTVEVGLRVFGHQSPRAMKDCKDSKLEVPIGKNTGPAIKKALSVITPQGNTPIAYSLFLAASDFVSVEGTNSIILITDGIENCEGDPCASTEALKEKRVVLKPFIIGLGLNDGDKVQFDCVGSFYDATDPASFDNVMHVVVSQALNTTTTQINLINAFGLPIEKNIEITFYDAFSGEVRYNFVHAVSDKNVPDTLYINPVGKYNIVAHTTPPVVLKDVELKPGKHNIIGIDVPLGTLYVVQGPENTFSQEQCVVRDHSTGEIVYVQNLNTRMKYIEGVYDIDILTLPRLHYEAYTIKGGMENKIQIELPGTLNISAHESTLYSIYRMQGDQLEKVYEKTVSLTPDLIKLLPGNYRIVYRSNIKKVAASTKEMEISIKTGKTTLIKL
ncbi:MAG: VWA domain-containing protein [Chitinophagales bacterium]